eukprot:s6492_g5.t1
MSGASLLDSKASFKTKVLGHGLPVALFHEAIARRGVATLSKAAYAVGAPGVLPSEDALRNFLNPETPAAAGQGQVPIVRRLTFVAQTLAVSQLRVSASKSRLTAWQALARRSLALDLCEAATFAASGRWHADLLRHLQQTPPLEYKQVGTMQILRADRAAWTFMAEQSLSLEKRPDGTLPMAECHRPPSWLNSRCPWRSVPMALADGRTL